MSKEEIISDNDSTRQKEWFASLTEELQRDVSTAIAILKEGGCSEVFVFGSLNTPDVNVHGTILI